nr:hydroxyethylthiazole kinase [Volvox reticuliferus]BCL66216.1 hydroxyethylthiazole kinase [Volvox reticuliferus]
MSASSSHSDGSLQLEATALSCWQLWQAVRTKRPLVHCITNFVSMDIMANVLLAAGCSPAMAHSLDEVESFIAISSSLLVNMGTLSPEWVAAKKLAAKKAVELGKPWVLDPVGCGATPVRTASCLELLACKPTVVRGNASEILALAGAAGNVKGVDSTATSSDAVEAAKQLASKHSCIVAVSGAVDYVTDGRLVVSAHNGHELLTLITAAGCSVTALIAAFVSVAPRQPLLATAHALAVFGLAAEEGLKVVPRPGPGSLRVALMDLLHLMQEETVLEGARVSVMTKRDDRE